MVAPMSNQAPAAQRVEPIPYQPFKVGEQSCESVFADAKPLLEQLDAFALKRREGLRGQAKEMETLGGGCALVKREVLRKMALFPAPPKPAATKQAPRAASRIRRFTEVRKESTTLTGRDPG